MKKIIPILLALSILTICCEKEKEMVCAEGLQEATIIGQDFRRCVCCGGWFIDLGQDTVRTFTLPDDFKFEPNKDLPIEVCLSYEAETGNCKDFDELIVVTQIVRR